ncbi:SMP-30/gluconolactonase/LRE family protein, partial [Bacteroidota bacterium]
ISNIFYKLTLVTLITFILIINVNSQSQNIVYGELEKIADGFDFVEGPVWVDGIGLLFSDIEANTVYKWNSDEGLSVYLNPSGKSNGLALGSDNKLLLAQHGERQLARLEDDGSFTTLASHYDTKQLNSPNDITVKSDGAIYFTDPPYGISPSLEELGYYGIYMLDTNGKLYMLDNSLNRPNGLALSLDETKLYVGDSEGRTIYVWDIINDSTLSNKEQFAFMDENGYTDGMKIDKYGNLFSSGPIGIWVYRPDGECIDTISVPGGTTNCNWGDDDRQTLYITSGTAVYSIRVEYSDTLTDTNQAGINYNNKSKISQLLNIYPNPIVNKAEIPFYLHKAGDVEIELINTAGIKIKTILHNQLSSGNHNVSWYAINEPAGIYFISLITENNIDLMKCTLIK